VAGSDGHIDINEFRDKMGILGSKLTERFSDRIYRSLDLDQDGYVTLYPIFRST
jgi:Ca2+-binding EF-hand superfamily protein